MMFEVVAAIFRLRKLLVFNISISQTKVCGYENLNSDTPSKGRGNIRNFPLGINHTTHIFTERCFASRTGRQAPRHTPPSGRMGVWSLNMTCNVATYFVRLL